VLGSMLLGCSHGIAQFYRYAAADGLPVHMKPKAISFVLLGGLAAAMLGPEIAYRFVDAIDGARYAGAFLVAGLCICLHLLPCWEWTAQSLRATNRKDGLWLYSFQCPVFVLGLSLPRLVML